MQLSNITINDSVPVARVFTPTLNNNGKVMFQHDDLSVSVLLRASASTQTRVGSATEKRRAFSKIRVPFSYIDPNTSEESIRYNEWIVTELFDQKSSQVNVEDTRALAMNYLATAIVTDAAENGRHPY